MATTTPDNLPSPEGTGPVVPVSAFKALANATQAALVKRSNAYIGTTAERLAFTSVPVGTFWADSNGTKRPYLHDGTGWNQLAFLSDATVISVSFVTAASGTLTQIGTTGNYASSPTFPVPIPGGLKTGERLVCVPVAVGSGYGVISINGSPAGPLAGPTANVSTRFIQMGNASAQANLGIMAFVVKMS